MGEILTITNAADPRIGSHSWATGGLNRSWDRLVGSGAFAKSEKSSFLAPEKGACQFPTGAAQRTCSMWEDSNSSRRRTARFHLGG
jgi:hypothetical protein